MKRILVLTDLSFAALNAADWAAMIAVRTGMDILVTKINDRGQPLISPDPPAAEELEHEVTRISHHIKNISGNKTCPKVYSLHHERPGGKIENAAELLMAVSAGKGDTLAKMMDLCSKKHIPVLLIPEKCDNIPNHPLIIFATDLSPADLPLASYVHKLALSLNGRYLVAHISKPSFNMASNEEQAIALFMSEMARYGSHNYDYQQYYFDDVPNGIEKLFEEKKGDILAIIPRHAFSGYTSYRHVTIRTIHKCKAPVLLLPQSMKM